MEATEIYNDFKEVLACLKKNCDKIPALVLNPADDHDKTKKVEMRELVFTNDQQWIVGEWDAKSNKLTT